MFATVDACYIVTITNCQHQQLTFNTAKDIHFTFMHACMYEHDR